MMRTGRGKASDVQIALVQSDVARLPLRNDTFDAVIAVHIFHLVSAWQQAMNEVARVVRHGGMLLHGTTKRDDDREHPLRKLMQDWANELQHQNDGRLSWNEINEQLAQCFGSPQEYMSPAWTTTHTPQCIID
jgi:ubiquinone/menaquinone biosynthesis C-methylase UbiE